MKWQAEEVQFLVDNYRENGLEFCANYLKKSTTAILHMASKLKLKRKGKDREPRQQIFQGYIQISEYNDRYFLHRRIMENHLGRKLTSNEVVHHINGDKLDNRLENLVVVTRSEHQRSCHKEDLASRRDSQTGKFTGYGV